MNCPSCGRDNDQSAAQCVCGHHFNGQAQAVVPASKSWRIFFHGEGGPLFGMHALNTLLTLLTAGIYYFWGKVKVRKFFYNETELDGDRFAYHGTGKELFLGWLKIAFLFAIYVAGLVAVQKYLGDSAEAVIQLVTMVLVLFLLPAVLVGSRRYRLSRTSWRGIRFSFRGSSGELLSIFLKGTFLNLLTFGFYTPYFLNKLRSFFTSHSYFGTRRFDYDGVGKELFNAYFKAYFLMLLTFGFYWFWYQAWLHRYYWDHTSFGNARFRSTVEGGELLGLSFTNWLMIVFTLGLAYPWAQVRNARFFVENLHLEGALDLDAIRQEAQEASATGEGAAEFLDAGAFDADIGL